ncbi:glycosyltransferase family 1 protein [Bradyrhizobium sp. KB893862 SZCCT0404]|uniref:glycosyltransferase family protein n=1 Tax=Bradyrhizobium sp. KB893862 SZCCT0404 TaxID=2807672 RepID=UPI001BA4622A|nr:glycosyltransferase [Bradyrhizobium sp. KB893862 SZCCT0404]MBR1174258.1 glycosyltransferase family 1 protein [Bradyrhizobium sp. KB893862 SZCCT0404]
MRLFQNSCFYPSYLPRFNQLAAKALSFDARREVFLNDRFGAAHFLQPVLDGSPEAFFTNGDDEILQRRWAREQGMSGEPTLEAILLAQIEHHATEVFYNLDPVRYPSTFVAKLPGCVKTTLCWRAAPSGNADFTAYGAVLGNFPSILDFWRGKGCRGELFRPAHDPVMDEYGHGERPIDAVFVGGYSRHHRARARTLERVAHLADSHNIVLCLDASRLTRLAESPIGRLLPLGRHRRPDAIAAIARPPVFGKDLYELIGSSKIVLNGAIDMAGEDRGNMRCFEAMGCGALLVSDAGRYPEGMQNGVTIETYGTPDQAAEVISRSLQDWPRSAEIAALGRARMRDIYGKDVQWKAFVDLVGRL